MPITRIFRNEKVLNFGLAKEELEKYKKLVAALATNDIESIDTIVDAFSTTEENRFQIYLDNLQPHEIEPTANLSMSSFLTSMFTYYRNKASNTSKDEINQINSKSSHEVPKLI